MLIDKGLLFADAELSCHRPTARATVNSDGSVTVFVKDTQKVFDYLSGAARFVEDKSLNGWLYWFVTVGGKKVPLDHLRDKFLDNCRGGPKIP